MKPINLNQDFSGEECLGDALLAMIQRFQNVKTIVTTLGERGSIALDMTNDSHEVTACIVLILTELVGRVHHCKTRWKKPGGS